MPVIGRSNQQPERRVTVEPSERHITKPNDPPRIRRHHTQHFHHCGVVPSAAAHTGHQLSQPDSDPSTFPRHPDHHVDPMGHGSESFTHQQRPHLGQWWQETSPTKHHHHHQMTAEGDRLSSSHRHVNHVIPSSANFANKVRVMQWAQGSGSWNPNHRHHPAPSLWREHHPPPVPANPHPDYGYMIVGDSDSRGKEEHTNAYGSAAHSRLLMTNQDTQPVEPHEGSLDDGSQRSTVANVSQIAANVSQIAANVSQRESFICSGSEGNDRRRPSAPATDLDARRWARGSCLNMPGVDMLHDRKSGLLDDTQTLRTFVNSDVMSGKFDMEQFIKSQFNNINFIIETFSSRFDELKVTINQALNTIAQNAEAYNAVLQSAAAAAATPVSDRKSSLNSERRRLVEQSRPPKIVNPDLLTNLKNYNFGSCSRNPAGDTNSSRHDRSGSFDNRELLVAIQRGLSTTKQTPFNSRERNAEVEKNEMIVDSIDFAATDFSAPASLSHGFGNSDSSTFSGGRQTYSQVKVVNEKGDEPLVTRLVDAGGDDSSSIVDVTACPTDLSDSSHRSNDSSGGGGGGQKRQPVAPPLPAKYFCSPSASRPISTDSKLPLIPETDEMSIHVGTSAEASNREPHTSQPHTVIASSEQTKTATLAHVTPPSPRHQPASDDDCSLDTSQEEDEEEEETNRIPADSTNLTVAPSTTETTPLAENVDERILMMRREILELKNWIGRMQKCAITVPAAHADMSAHRRRNITDSKAHNQSAST